MGTHYLQEKGFSIANIALLVHKTQVKRTDFTSKTGCSYPIKDFISCHTEGVVYVLQCTCNLQYVGRTKRPLMVRIREPIQNIKGFPKHTVFIGV